MPTATPETDAIGATLRSEFHAEPDIVAAYLYGSVARGNQRRDSDIDVAFLLESDPPATLESLRLDLAARIEKKTGRPVQIVILNRAPCDLAHRVRRGGVILIDREPRKRVAWEVKSRNEYFHMKPTASSEPPAGSTKTSLLACNRWSESGTSLCMSTPVPILRSSGMCWRIASTIYGNSAEKFARGEPASSPGKFLQTSAANSCAGKRRTASFQVVAASVTLSDFQ